MYSILKLLLALVMVIAFIIRNLKDCLMNKLILLKQSNYEITPELNYYGTKTRVEFNGSCLKEDKITYTYVKTFALLMN